MVVFGRFGVALLLLAFAATATACPPAVSLDAADGTHRLLRAGVPYVIRGGGGNGSLHLLAESGGNSVRTWGHDGAGRVLDEAHALGLTVTLGIWLGQPRQGFDYNDPDQVARQADDVRQAVLRYKGHPALLMWGLGNEIEGEGRDAAVWSALNNLAAMTKALDPGHPTMTALAEIGGDKVRNLHRLCPAIDVVGINSYGGVASVPERYRKAGGTKPFVLTEYGPPGRWEVAKTPWGAAPEATSTAKVPAYRAGFHAGHAGSGGLGLGSYAFLWGHKQEATSTWFGLLLPDGRRTAGADALAELWSGRPPANRCPTVGPITLEGPAKLPPGTTFKVTLSAADPEDDPIDVRWALRPEGTYGQGGDAEAAPADLPDAILKADRAGAEVRLPTAGGAYRLFATVTDDHGGAATANLPVYVDAPVVIARGRPARLPLIVYDEAGDAAAYVPSGWMGAVKAIRVDPADRTEPHSGATCLRVDCDARRGWAGVVWQDPANDWGDRPGGFDLSQANRLTFWARGATGGESVRFEFGLIGPDKPVPDTARGTTGEVILNRDWTRYQIDLAGKDLSRIKTGFAWVVPAGKAPVAFFLDEIRFE